MTIKPSPCSEVSEQILKIAHRTERPDSELVQLREQNTALDAKCAELEKRLKDMQRMCLGYQEEFAVLRKDASRYKWLSAYFVSDDTEHDDAIVSASSFGVDALHAAIDAAMQKEQS